VRETGDETASDWIRLKIHCNDRNRRRRVRRRPDGGRAHRQDHIRLEPDRFGCIFTKSRLAAGRESILDENALSLDVAEVAESLPEHFLWRPWPAEGIGFNSTTRKTFVADCASTTRGGAKRLTASATATTIPRIDTSADDGWREPSREGLAGGTTKDAAAKFTSRPTSPAARSPPAPHRPHRRGT
jgi:hypothetical protein